MPIRTIAVAAPFVLVVAESGQMLLYTASCELRSVLPGHASPSSIFHTHRSGVAMATDSELRTYRPRPTASKESPLTTLRNFSSPIRALVNFQGKEGKTAWYMGIVLESEAVIARLPSHAVKSVSIDDIDKMLFPEAKPSYFWYYVGTGVAVVAGLVYWNFFRYTGDDWYMY